MLNTRQDDTMSDSKLSFSVLLNLLNVHYVARRKMHSTQIFDRKASLFDIQASK